jgi:hypothetical protein
MCFTRCQACCCSDRAHAKSRRELLSASPTCSPTPTRRGFGHAEAKQATSPQTSLSELRQGVGSICAQACSHSRHSVDKQKVDFAQELQFDKLRLIGCCPKVYCTKGQALHFQRKSCWAGNTRIPVLIAPDGTHPHGQTWIGVRSRQVFNAGRLRAASFDNLTVKLSALARSVRRLHTRLVAR